MSAARKKRQSSRHARGYLGPAHATCNLRAAAHKRNATRKEHQLIWSRVWFEPIPPNVTLNRTQTQTEPPPRPACRPSY